MYSKLKSNKNPAFETQKMAMIENKACKQKETEMYFYINKGKTKQIRQ